MTQQTLLSAKEVRKKEAYYTAGQYQLVWARFKKNRPALLAGAILLFFILIGVFAEFVAPYAPTKAGYDRSYLNGPPQWPSFWDHNGFSARPFVYTYKQKRDENFHLKFEVEKSLEDRRYLQFFVEGWKYHLVNTYIDLPGEALDFYLTLVPMNRHLFGVDKGKIHLFGSDRQKKDLFSRIVFAIRISLSIGMIGVFIAFTLALVIGGTAGYYGGWPDRIIQMITDAVRVVPTIPLFMALAAFVPPEWSSEARFFFISMILGFIGWPTLARRVRTHILAERSQDYILASKLCGARAPHIIRRHLLPSFTSYIIVDLVISFPYMVLSETALSFVGLGLKDPVNSLGVLLQNVTDIDIMLNYQWYFIPVIFFIILVLAFVFVGDGLRDAADPYSDSKK
jgi:peptide/nickel transport system permease protein